MHPTLCSYINSERHRVFLFSSNAGTGTKLLQSHIDNHSQVICIPGYPLMYLLPYLDSVGLLGFRVEEGNRFLHLFCKQFDSIFDSRNRPGSEDLNRLGKNRNEYLSINEDVFGDEFLSLISSNNATWVSIEEIIVAIHLAYNQASTQKDPHNSIILYHIHSELFVDRYIPRFGARIGMARCPHAHLSKRVLNSFDKPNRTKLRLTSCEMVKPYGPAALSEWMIDSKRSIQQTNQDYLVVRHEDLNSEEDILLRRLCSYMGIKYESIMSVKSFGGIVWDTSFYNWVGKEDGLPNREILNSQVAFKKGFIPFYEAARRSLVYYDYYIRNDYQPVIKIDNKSLRMLSACLAALLPSPDELVLFGKYLVKMPSLVLLSWNESVLFSNFKLEFPYGDNLFYDFKLLNLRLNHRSLSNLETVALEMRKTNNKLAIFIYYLSRLIEVLINPLRFPYYYLLRSRFELLYVLESLT